MKNFKKRWTLKNKKAVVTGATKGIGKAIVEEIAELGAEVFIISRNESDLKKLCKDLSEKKFKIIGNRCDVTSKADRNDVFKKVKSEWGKLDILINNAGTNTRKTTLDNSEKDFDQLIDLNLNGFGTNLDHQRAGKGEGKEEAFERRL